MSDLLVRAAFESRIKNWAAAQSPAILVSYENVGFTPPTTRYLRCFILPAPTVSLDLARDHRQRKGVFQVTIVMPIGAGTAAAAAIQAALEVAFPINVYMTQSAIRVWLTTPFSPGPAIQESDSFAVSVSAQYACDTYP
jgi:hypothetical protein